MNDFSRQSNVFNPAKFDTPVHVIGAGATGSWITMLLAKLGIKDITVWDFDTVGEHNLPNQLFRESYSYGTEDDFANRESDIGENKAAAIADVAFDFTGIDIKSKSTKVDGDTRGLEGIVFVLTDTMASRKEIWENCLMMNPNVKMVVETRMGLRDGRIYAVNPMNFDHVTEYEKTLYSDEDAEVSACGVSQSIAPTATFIASLAVWNVIKFHNNPEHIINEVIHDVESAVQLTKKFGAWE